MGVRVEASATGLELPYTCAGCNGEATTRALAWGPGFLHPHAELSVPICAQCAKGPGPGAVFLLHVGALGGLAIVTAVLVGRLVADGWGAAALSGSVWLGVVVLLVIRYNKRRAGMWPPVEMRLARGRAQLYCSNDAWGAQLAEASQSHCSRAKRPFNGSYLRASSAFLGISMLVTVPIGFAAGAAKVRVEHPGNQPVQLWIDGERNRVLRPSVNPTAFHARDRTVEIGLSSVEAPKPERVYTAPLDDTLIDVGGKGCFWRHEVKYGEEGIVSTTSTLLALKEVHHIEGVSMWFRAPPEWVVESGKNARRVVVSRDQMCRALAQRGCSAEVLRNYVTCQRAASRGATGRNDDNAACEAAAQRACPGGGT